MMTRTRIHWIALIALVVVAALIGACGKEEEVDPVVRFKEMIPVIESALNSNDLAKLGSLGTDRFDVERFVTDVFSRGVTGDVALRFQGARILPDEARLTLIAKFGADGSGGTKELTLNFAGTDRKLDTYGIRDRNIPSSEDVDVLKKQPPDTSAVQKPS